MLNLPQDQDLPQADVPTESNLKAHFQFFRERVVGYDYVFDGPYGPKPLVYADWTASGRMYQPIEDYFNEIIYPLVGNTHTTTTVTGTSMTVAYKDALRIIKQHVNAGPKDVIISCASGMTGVINKMQRILGFRIHERYRNQVHLPENDRPLVIVSHMEHHSNQTSWLESLVDMEIIRPCGQGKLDLNHLQEILDKYPDRKLKIASITACSNVSGVETPFHDVAKVMHENGGYCFVDFACSAPYVPVDMHPSETNSHLDAIFFSPHKFLGGPASTGIMVFNSDLYTNQVPDHPGGGTVEWTNPWGGHRYIHDIEEREDGGTPAFLQTIRASLAVKVKEAMRPDLMLKQENLLLERLWGHMEAIPNLEILARNIKERLGVISFYIPGLHYNLGVRILNDRFGIQVRGGCSCAGTYGHFLLHVDPAQSQSITEKIDSGDYSMKPGWIRVSLHPTMTLEEMDYIGNAMAELAANHQEWMNDYVYDAGCNEYQFKSTRELPRHSLTQGFDSFHRASVK